MKEVHCWCVTLDVPLETSARLYATLSSDERDRSARLRFAPDRQRFITARGVLRDLLGQYLSTRPDQVRFTYNAFGKPELSAEFGGRLRFNLSHSGDLALIGITTDTAIGVDLEYLRPQPYYADIAGHLDPQAFFSGWTRQEAYLKARGDGLANLDGPPTDAGLPGSWSLYPLHPAPGYVGALVVEGRGPHRLSGYRAPCTVSSEAAACRFVVPRDRYDPRLLR